MKNMYARYQVSQSDVIFSAFSYRENAQRLSKAYRDRPAAPLETAIWWTEYIARGNGNPYLRSDSADLPWYQHRLIDVALVLIIVFTVFIYILFRLIKLLLSLLSAVKGKARSQVEKKEEKKDWWQTRRKKRFRVRNERTNIIFSCKSCWRYANFEWRDRNKFVIVESLLFTRTIEKKARFPEIVYIINFCSYIFHSSI